MGNLGFMKTLTDINDYCQERLQVCEDKRITQAYKTLLMNGVAQKGVNKPKG